MLRDDLETVSRGPDWAKPWAPTNDVQPKLKGSFEQGSELDLHFLKFILF